MRKRQILSLLFLGLVGMVPAIPPQVSAVPEVRSSFVPHIHTLHGLKVRSGLLQSTAEPVPSPGGIQVPGGPFIHIFFPGPESLNPLFMGIDVEPSVITDFRGFSAIAYLAGTATGNDGKLYNLEADIRVYQGEYVASDGSHHFGTFALI
jgi:hypothetical protein